MVVSEHLNWHADMADYRQAKANLFAHQTAKDIAIYFADSENSHAIASKSPGAKITYYAPPGAYVEDGQIKIDDQVVCATDEIKLLGAHNWQNACAAITAVWQVVQDVNALRSVLTTFTGLEHRLEFVREVNGVRYYNDSFGTTPETAIVAMQAFKEPKVVILGGSDKGSVYDELAVAVTENNVRAVVLIGEMGPKIGEELKAAGYTTLLAGGENITDIVRVATEAAKPGDIVLLSTGCASFGLFGDYKDRGKQFKTAVGAL
jgi:UDP-N-acetylmuramoylalanine--D-glutamate ligase